MDATQKSLVPPLILCLLVVSCPVSYSSDNLVKNEGFETADFRDWTTVNSQVLYSRGPASGGVPGAHSGDYYARIGTETGVRRITQTVLIPRGSTGKFTAWYRLDRESRLTAFLEKTDGAVIEQREMTGPVSWTSVTYDIPVTYAGQPMTIGFEGVGYAERVPRKVWSCDAYSCAEFEWVDVSYHWAFVDDISVTCVAVEPTTTETAVSKPTSAMQSSTVTAVTTTRPVTVTVTMPTTEIVTIQKEEPLNQGLLLAAVIAVAGLIAVSMAVITRKTRQR